MPLYNKAPYVRKAVESVIGQMYVDWELVIVDDCSTDGSCDVVANFSDSRIRLVRLEKNGGVGAARNQGVAESAAPFICFLDADDWWEPTFLEEMSVLINEFPDAGIYGTNYTIVNETKHKTRVAKIGVEDVFEKGYINYCQVYAKTMYMPLWTGAVCIPRLVFDETGGFPEGIKLGEDFLLWIRIALKHKVVLLNKSLSNYNQDVDVTYRGTHHLRNPKEHMLWNLGDLESEEESNPDYKRLIDNLRTYELMPFLLTKRYRNMARKELSKVDWSFQTENVRKLYQAPIRILKVRQLFLVLGSFVKTSIRKIR